MPKILLMAEGAQEKALLDILVDRGLLIFNRSDLLYEEVSSERQFSQSLLAKIGLLKPGETLDVYR